MNQNNLGQINNINNQTTESETVAEIPEHIYKLISGIGRKASKRFQISESPFGVIYFEQVHLLKKLFPNKEWNRIIDNLELGDSTRGSKYNLKKLYQNHFSEEEKDRIRQTINRPERLCKTPTVIGIEEIYTVSSDNYYKYVLTKEEQLFKVPNTEVQLDGNGALKVGCISPGIYLEQPNLIQINGQRIWRRQYKEVAKPINYIMDFLSGLEVENYERKLEFERSLSNI